MRLTFQAPVFLFLAHLSPIQDAQKLTHMVHQKMGLNRPSNITNYIFRISDATFVLQRKFTYLIQAYPSCRNLWNKREVGGHFG